MQLISIAHALQILRPGVPLPFGVRDAEGRLLLAQGHVLTEYAKLRELVDRGMYVDREELAKIASRPALPCAETPVEERFSERWEAMQCRLCLLLRGAGEPAFLAQIHEVALRLAHCAHVYDDQILFLVFRRELNPHETYAEVHSLQVAALCSLVSARLGWAEARRLSVIGAALTMNLGMVQLQSQLAGQRTPPTPVQRQEIQQHPLVSAALLRAAGLQDEVWLAAVEQHHECPGGGGYPRGLPDPSEESQLLRFVDSFVAKHSARAGRTPMPAHQAAKELFAQSGGNPLAAALIKECGVYPPGCFVRLASGETAIVTRRGAKATQPLVMALTNAEGEPLSRPVQRDTAQPARAIVVPLAEAAVKVRFSADDLYG